jgi:hypothetical protein
MFPWRESVDHQIAIDIWPFIDETSTLQVRVGVEYQSLVTQVMELKAAARMLPVAGRGDVGKTLGPETAPIPQ